jgi:hypothetical protein
MQRSFVVDPAAAVGVWHSEKLEMVGSGSLRTDQMQRSLLAVVGSAAAVGVCLSEKLEMVGSGSSRTGRMPDSLLAVVGFAAVGE